MSAPKEVSFALKLDQFNQIKAPSASFVSAWQSICKLKLIFWLLQKEEQKRSLILSSLVTFQLVN